MSFVTNIAEIRARARQQIERGPIPNVWDCTASDSAPSAHVRSLSFDDELWNVSPNDQG